MRREEHNSHWTVSTSSRSRSSGWNVPDSKAIRRLWLAIEHRWMSSWNPSSRFGPIWWSAVVPTEFWSFFYDISIKKRKRHPTRQETSYISLISTISCKIWSNLRLAQGLSTVWSFAQLCSSGTPVPNSIDGLRRTDARSKENFTNYILRGGFSLPVKL